MNFFELLEYKLKRNGGLQWEEVKNIIIKYANSLMKKDINIEIYEPSLNYKAKTKSPPKLTLSHYYNSLNNGQNMEFI